MKLKKKTDALILIYILFLVTISIVFSTILINNNAFLFNISRYFDVESKLFSNINSDASILVNINRELNSNWEWFSDNAWCPELPWGVSMSWTTVAASLSTTLVNSGAVYCEGDYFWKSLRLYFNTAFDEIISADFDWSAISIIAWVWTTPFTDPDNTLIDISWDIYYIPDWIDDNFDSDNYMVTSSWTIATGTYYSDWYQDDDVLWRMQYFWYVTEDFWFKKVFWNTSKVLKLIDENDNNWDSLNEKIWVVSDWIFHFDIDKSFDIRIVNFDRNIFNTTKELKIKSRIDWTMSAGVWYLQSNAGVLSLSETITWNELEFDFANEDYAIFIKDTWAGTLLYKIKAETLSWKWIYIIPINDEDENVVEFVWNEIIIDEKWWYISKETELIFKK